MNAWEVIKKTGSKLKKTLSKESTKTQNSTPKNETKNNISSSSSSETFSSTQSKSSSSESTDFNALVSSKINSEGSISFGIEEEDNSLMEEEISKNVILNIKITNDKRDIFDTASFASGQTSRKSSVSTEFSGSINGSQRNSANLTGFSIPRKNNSLTEEFITSPVTVTNRPSSAKLPRKVGSFSIEVDKTKTINCR